MLHGRCLGPFLHSVVEVQQIDIAPKVLTEDANGSTPSENAHLLQVLDKILSFEGAVIEDEQIIENDGFFVAVRFRQGDMVFSVNVSFKKACHGRIQVAHDVSEASEVKLLKNRLSRS